MRLSGSVIFRAMGWLAAGSFVVAIAVGRMCAPTPVLRGVEAARFWNVPSRTPGHAESSPAFVDLGTGDPLMLPLPRGEALTQPACAPWKDESGGTQVAGAWRRVSGDDAALVTSEFGLARFSFPGGEPLDRVPSDIIPEGAPCWYPGTTARILFAAADGGLYRFAFEGARGPDTSDSGCEARPSPIVWKVTPPGDDERSVRIADPVWPADRRLGGRLIVSLRYQVREGNRLRFTPARPWALKLDRAGEAIEEATPLGQDLEPAGVKVRFPRVHRAPDGTARLIYLAQRSGRPSWDLRTAPLTLASDGIPQIASEPETIVEAECAFGPPALSPDDRWVYFLPADPRIAGPLRAPTTRRQGLAQVVPAR